MRDESTSFNKAQVCTRPKIRMRCLAINEYTGLRKGRIITNTDNKGQSPFMYWVRRRAAQDLIKAEWSRMRIMLSTAGSISK